MSGPLESGRPGGPEDHAPGGDSALPESQRGAEGPAGTDPTAGTDRTAGSTSPGLPSLPKRVFAVLFSPVELFRALRETPAFVGPMLLGAVVTGAGAALIPAELMEEAIREQFLAAGQDPGTQLGTAARVGWVIAVFGPLVIWPILTFLMAGLYSLVFLFGFGFRGRFRQILSVTAHALLVAALGALLLSPLRVAAGDPQLTLSVGTFFFFLPEGYPLRFLELLDLFNVWTYLLVGVGAAVVDGNAPPGRGAVIAVAAAALLSLVIAAFMG